MVSQRQPSYVKAVYISLLIIIIIFIMIMGKPLLVPLLLSGYIAMLLTPFCNRLERMKIPSSLSAFIALFLFLSFITGIIIFIVTQVRHLINDLETNIPQRLDKFAVRLNKSVHDSVGFDIGMGHGLEVEKIMEIIRNGKTSSVDLVSMTISTLTSLTFIPVFIFFLLIYRNHLAVFVTKVFERQKNRILMEHIVSIRETVHDYITGAGKVMLILGVVNTGVLLALGIE
ncbi:MAG TPA: AI-2E family transporter, partial [Flavobacterium sp.]